MSDHSSDDDDYSDGSSRRESSKPQHHSDSEKDEDSYDGSSRSSRSYDSRGSRSDSRRSRSTRSSSGSYSRRSGRSSQGSYDSRSRSSRSSSNASDYADNNSQRSGSESERSRSERSYDDDDDDNSRRSWSRSRDSEGSHSAGNRSSRSSYDSRSRSPSSRKSRSNHSNHSNHDENDEEEEDSRRASSHSSSYSERSSSQRSYDSGSGHSRSSSRGSQYSGSSRSSRSRSEQSRSSIDDGSSRRSRSQHSDNSSSSRRSRSSRGSKSSHSSRDSEEEYSTRSKSQRSDDNDDSSRSRSTVGSRSANLSRESQDSRKSHSRSDASFGSSRSSHSRSSQSSGSQTGRSSQLSDAMEDDNHNNTRDDNFDTFGQDDNLRSNTGASQSPGEKRREGVHNSSSTGREEDFSRSSRQASVAGSQASAESSREANNDSRGKDDDPNDSSRSSRSSASSQSDSTSSASTRSSRSSSSAGSARSGSSSSNNSNRDGDDDAADGTQSENASRFGNQNDPFASDDPFGNDASKSPWGDDDPLPTTSASARGGAFLSDDLFGTDDSPAEAGATDSDFPDFPKADSPPDKDDLFASPPSSEKSDFDDDDDDFFESSKPKSLHMMGSATGSFSSSRPKSTSDLFNDANEAEDFFSSAGGSTSLSKKLSEDTKIDDDAFFGSASGFRSTASKDRSKSPDSGVADLFSVHDKSIASRDLSKTSSVSSEHTRNSRTYAASKDETTFLPKTPKKTLSDVVSVASRMSRDSKDSRGSSRDPRRPKAGGVTISEFLPPRPQRSGSIGSGMVSRGTRFSAEPSITLTDVFTPSVTGSVSPGSQQESREKVQRSKSDSANVQKLYPNDPSIALSDVFAPSVASFASPNDSRGNGSNSESNDLSENRKSTSQEIDFRPSPPKQKGGLFSSFRSNKSKQSKKEAETSITLADVFGQSVGTSAAKSRDSASSRQSGLTSSSPPTSKSGKSASSDSEDKSSGEAPAEIPFEPSPEKKPRSKRFSLGFGGSSHKSSSEAPSEIPFEPSPEKKPKSRRFSLGFLSGSSHHQSSSSRREMPKSLNEVFQPKTGDDSDSKISSIGGPSQHSKASVGASARKKAFQVPFIAAENMSSEAQDGALLSPTGTSIQAPVAPMLSEEVAARPDISLRDVFGSPGEEQMPTEKSTTAAHEATSDKDSSKSGSFFEETGEEPNSSGDVFDIFRDDNESGADFFGPAKSKGAKGAEDQTYGMSFDDLFNSPSSHSKPSVVDQSNSLGGEASTQSSDRKLVSQQAPAPAEEKVPSSTADFQGSFGPSVSSSSVLSAKNVDHHSESRRSTSKDYSSRRRGQSSKAQPPFPYRSNHSDKNEHISVFGDSVSRLSSASGLTSNHNDAQLQSSRRSIETKSSRRSSSQDSTMRSSAKPSASFDDLFSDKEADAGGTGTDFEFGFLPPPKSNSRLLGDDDRSESDPSDDMGGGSFNLFQASSPGKSDDKSEKSATENLLALAEELSKEETQVESISSIIAKQLGKDTRDEDIESPSGSLNCSKTSWSKGSRSKRSSPRSASGRDSLFSVSSSKLSGDGSGHSSPRTASKSSRNYHGSERSGRSSMASSQSSRSNSGSSRSPSSPLEASKGSPSSSTGSEGQSFGKSSSRSAISRSRHSASDYSSMGSSRRSSADRGSQRPSSRSSVSSSKKKRLGDDSSRSGTSRSRHSSASSHPTSYHRRSDVSSKSSSVGSSKTSVSGSMGRDKIGSSRSTRTQSQRSSSHRGSQASSRTSTSSRGSDRSSNRSSSKSSRPQKQGFGESSSQSSVSRFGHSTSDRSSTASSHFSRTGSGSRMQSTSFSKGSRSSSSKSTRSDKQSFGEDSSRSTSSKSSRIPSSRKKRESSSSSSSSRSRASSSKQSAHSSSLLHDSVVGSSRLSFGFGDDSSKSPASAKSSSSSKERDPFESDSSSPSSKAGSSSTYSQFSAKNSGGSGQSEPVNQEPQSYATTATARDIWTYARTSPSMAILKEIGTGLSPNKERIYETISNDGYLHVVEVAYEKLSELRPRLKYLLTLAEWRHIHVLMLYARLFQVEVEAAEILQPAEFQIAIPENIQVFEPFAAVLNSIGIVQDPVLGAEYIPVAKPLRHGTPYKPHDPEDVTEFLEWTQYDWNASWSSVELSRQERRREAKENGVKIPEVTFPPNHDKLLDWENLALEKWLGWDDNLWFSYKQATHILSRKVVFVDFPNPNTINGTYSWLIPRSSHDSGMYCRVPKASLAPEVWMIALLFNFSALPQERTNTWYYKTEATLDIDELLDGFLKGGFIVGDGD